MVDLLGIGVPSRHGGWLLHRLSARLETGQLTAVVSREPRAKTALLDAVSGRLVPAEGRAWIRGLPVAHETLGLVRKRVAEVDLRRRLVDERSVLCNVLSPASRRLDMARTWWRAASASWRREGLRALQSVGLDALAESPFRGLDRCARRRVLVARALMSGAEVLVVHDVDDGLSLSDAADVVGVLRTLARARQLTVLASLTDPVLLQMFAQRVLALEAGRLVFDGPPGAAVDSRWWLPATLAPTG
jgi:phosphonate transport system ATP-binding protein